MQIKKRLSNQIITRNYNHIIAWGSGPLFRANYCNSFFPIDYIIDGTGRQIGQVINGKVVKAADSLRELSGSILIVIYAIYEAEILTQISNLAIEADTISYPLVEIQTGNHVLPPITAKYAEDMITLNLLRQLEVNEPQFIEIGVCHPMMRNNTFLLHELFSCSPNYKGILVEANPLCWPLIEEYRPHDKLIKKGVSSEAGTMPFYVFPQLLGYSTFMADSAERQKQRGYHYEVIEIETDTLNHILESNFNQTPDLLAIDAEGLDYDIISGWDYQRYPFKVIIVEYLDDSESPLKKILAQRGYSIYATTRENMIYVRNDLRIQV